MIGSFKDTEAASIFDGERSRRYAGLERMIDRKIRLIEAAIKLSELATPPGNRLEALRGDRRHQHSIRINQQFRICFRWEGQHAYEIEIVDYH